MKNLTICLLAHEETQILKKVAKQLSWAKVILILDNESGIEWQQYFPQSTQLQVHPISGQIADFAALRNLALQLCTTDWIFFVDSDEVLTPGAEIELLRVVQSGAAGAAVTRSDIFQGTRLAYGEAGNQQIIRICKVAHTTFSGAVHERAEVQGSVIPTEILLEHHAHRSINQFIESVTTYAQLAAAEERFEKMNFSILLLQLSCFPLLKFFQNYLLRAGFRDGYAGLVYASCMSLHSLLVRIYAYERRIATATSH